MYWERISNFFWDSEKYSLWGTDDISYKDTRQGFLGDCWLQAAVAAVA